MNILSIQNVVKKYQDHVAVNEVSLDIPSGKIFGLLGPNGAGKTSLIRIITTITAADQGQVFFQDQLINSSTPEKIGYMPEERGLYKKMKVKDHLVYLARLKGMPKTQAEEKIDAWFERFDISDWENKKIQELSKGMQQKIQFIATVLHEPPLLILDEPFSGLDPINTSLIKDEIYRLNKNGASIIFSTHRMEQVEEICDEIALINRGVIKLTGNVDDVRNQHKENHFEIEFRERIPEKAASNVKIIKTDGRKMIFQSPDESSADAYLKDLIQAGYSVKSYREILPTINEIFIKTVGKNEIDG